MGGSLRRGWCRVSFPHERNTLLSRGVRWGEKGMPPPYKATSRNAEDGFLSGITACWFIVQMEDCGLGIAWKIWHCIDAVKHIESHI
ncbi:hypothetical protein Bca4012_006214 [Brassica carinata]